jgi:hypothetical protein
MIIIERCTKGRRNILRSRSTASGQLWVPLNRLIIYEKTRIVNEKRSFDIAIISRDH